MPSDSNGVYALPSGYLAVTGEAILASQHNPPLEDIRDALTARVMRNGAGAMTGALKMGDNKITGLLAGTAATDAAAFAQTGFFKKLPESVKTDNYTVSTGDAGTMLIGNKATAITFALPTVASATGGAYFVRNVGVGAITLDPDGTETIEGATTLVLIKGDAAIIWVTASGWKAFLSLAPRETRLTGEVIPWAGATAPSGWLLCSGLTIGDASSGGTARANADTEALFSLLWGSFGNTELPIQDSAGAASTRGANAAADFAAHKRLPLPDLRGRVVAGQDDMGGTSANRLTAPATTVGGLNGDTFGATGGAETHVLLTAQMPSHTHGFAVQNGEGSVTPRDGANSSVLDGSTGPAGGDAAHNNVQPTIILNYIIKT